MKRSCVDCGIDTSERHLYAKRCVPCAKERKRATTASWKKANPKRFRESQEAWRDANWEHVRARTRLTSRRWYEANSEKIKASRERQRQKRERIAAQKEETKCE